MTTKIVNIQTGKVEEAAVIVPGAGPEERILDQRDRAYRASEVRKDGTPSTKSFSGSYLGVKIGRPYSRNLSVPYFGLEGQHAPYDEAREAIADARRGEVAELEAAVRAAQTMLFRAEQALLAVYADDATRDRLERLNADTN